MSEAAWIVAGASGTGSSHHESGEGCQDAFAFQVCMDERGLAQYVVAVSDGAGTAQYAAEAATLATQSTVDALIARLRSGDQMRSFGLADVSELVGHVQTVLQEAAKAATSELREFACTLLVAVVNSEESFFIQLGDGGMVFRKNEDSTDYELAFWPESGEYANTTNFLSDDDAVFSVRFRLEEVGVVEVAVFTDGLQRIVLDYESRQPFRPFFAPVFGQLNADATDIDCRLREFLESERIGQRTDDDRTLVLLARRVKGPDGREDDPV